MQSYINTIYEVQNNMEAQKKDPFEAGWWRDLEKLYRRGNIPAELKRIRRVLKDNFDCGFLKGHNNTLAPRPSMLELFNECGWSEQRNRKAIPKRSDNKKRDPRLNR